MKKIRLRVKEVAEQRAISMTKLHMRTELSYNTIRKIFRNPYAEVSSMTLERIANVLEVSPVDLIEWVEDSRAD